MEAPSKKSWEGSNVSLLGGVIIILSFERLWPLHPPAQLCLRSPGTWWPEKGPPLAWEDRKICRKSRADLQIRLLSNEMAPELNSADLSVSTSYRLNPPETNSQCQGDAPELTSLLSNGVSSPSSLTGARALTQKARMCSDLGNKRFTQQCLGFLFVQN